MDPFCKLYPRWRAQSSIIHENTHCFTILSTTPAVPGQLLIATKRHVENIDALTMEESHAFLQAEREAFEVLMRTYCSLQLKQFYESIAARPPFPRAGEYARAMLTHPHLEIVPSGYNTVSNQGEDAGQSVPHLHKHLFPRRGDDGIVAAMKAFEKAAGR